jgi:hypothetical protein
MRIEQSLFWSAMQTENVESLELFQQRGKFHT